jgi:hypothetical protein
MKISDYRYTRLREYERFLRLNFEPCKTINVNRFYVYFYKFSLAYKLDILKYFDFRPLVWIFRVNKTHAWGINMHKLSVEGRLEWMSRIRKLSEDINDKLALINFDDGRYYRIPGISYPKIIKIFKKAKIAIHCYKLENIIQPRRVQLSTFSEAALFRANTYFNCTYKEIAMRFKRYIPHNI